MDASVLAERVDTLPEAHSASPWLTRHLAWRPRCRHIRSPRLAESHPISQQMMGQGMGRFAAGCRRPNDAGGYTQQPY